MPEREQISNDTWNQHQTSVGGQPVNERIRYARNRVNYHMGRIRDDNLSVIGSVGLAGGAAALQYFDVAPEQVRAVMVILGGLGTLRGSLGKQEDRRKKGDWEEITRRELAVSRPEIAREDLTLARAIYEGELAVTSQEEVVDLKEALDYLRRKGMLSDSIRYTIPIRKPDNQVESYKTLAEKEIEALGEKTISERVNTLNNMVASRENQAKGLTALISFSVPSAAAAGILGFLQEIPKGWSWGVSGFLAASSAGNLMIMRATRLEKKKAQELLEREEFVQNHPLSSGDETLARIVYDLDMHPTEDQLINLKKILDSLRELGLITDGERSDPHDPSLDKN